VAAASLDDNGFLRNCNSAGTEDAENQNVVAFVMPQMLWSAAKRRIEFRVRIVTRTWLCDSC
jgi:hypothetical protein